MKKYVFYFYLKLDELFAQSNNSTCIDSALYVKNNRHLYTHTHSLSLSLSLFLCARSWLLYSDAFSPIFCRLGASHPRQQCQGLCASPAREEHCAMSLHLNIWYFLVSRHDPNLRSPGPSVLMQPSHLPGAGRELPGLHGQAVCSCL